MASRGLGDRMEGKGWLGWTIGAVVLAPVVVPAISKALRPVAKEGIKGFLALSEKAREMLAETSEQMQDLVAEAKAEYEQEGVGAGMMAETSIATPEGGMDAPADVAVSAEEDGASAGSRGRKSAAAAEAEAV